MVVDDVIMNMGQVYLPQQHERTILRNYDEPLSEVVQRFVEQGLEEEGILDSEEGS